MGWGVKEGGGVGGGGGDRVDWGDGMRNVDVSDVTTLRRTSKYLVYLLDPGFQDFSKRVFVCMCVCVGGGGGGVDHHFGGPQSTVSSLGPPPPLRHFISSHPQFLL